jgi:hypothetical protein
MTKRLNFAHFREIDPVREVDMLAHSLQKE